MNSCATDLNKKQHDAGGNREARSMFVLNCGRAPPSDPQPATTSISALIYIQELLFAAA